MFDPNMELLSTVLYSAASELREDPVNTSAWGRARTALAAIEEEEPELALVLECEDLPALCAQPWSDIDRHAVPVGWQAVV